MSHHDAMACCHTPWTCSIMTQWLAVILHEHVPSWRNVLLSYSMNMSHHDAMAFCHTPWTCPIMTQCLAVIFHEHVPSWRNVLLSYSMNMSHHDAMACCHTPWTCSIMTQWLAVILHEHVPSWRNALLSYSMNMSHHDAMACCHTPWWHWFGGNATSWHSPVALTRTFCCSNTHVIFTFQQCRNSSILFYKSLQQGLHLCHNKLECWCRR